MRTVLLVDDDEDDKLILTSALEEVDHAILLRTASDGFEGLEILQRDVLMFPDYIFLDLNMPRLDGFGFLREVKKITGLKTIPIIIYTTSSDQRDVNTSRQLGADYFVTKPTRISDIHEVIKDIFENGVNSSRSVRSLKAPVPNMPY